MIEYELKNIDPDDISDLLIKVEKSFEIKFGDKELMNISTFGALCDHITNKIQLVNSDDCTSQQAFYKLRNIISLTLQLDNKTISTNSLLEDLFKCEFRRVLINDIENQLGFKLNILRPPHWITMTLLIFLFASLVGIFINWQIGLCGFLFSIVGFWLAHKIGNEFDLQTVGQVAEKMTRENYLQSRRNSKTFNRNEIEKILIDLCGNDLDIEKGKLTRDTKFV